MKREIKWSAVLVLIGIGSLLMGLFFCVISPKSVYNFIEEQTTSASDFDRFNVLAISDNLYAEQAIIPPEQDIESMVMFFDNCSQVSAGIVKVQVLDEQAKSLYKFEFEPHAVASDSFCLITEKIKGIKKGEIYYLYISTEGISDGEAINVRVTDEMLNEEVFLPLNYSGTEVAQNVLLLIKNQQRIFKQGSYMFVYVNLCLIFVGVLIGFFNYLLSKMHFKIIRKTTIKRNILGLCFVLFLIIGCSKTPSLVKKNNEINFFTYDKVQEFNSVALANTGEIKQSFVAKEDILKSFILIYDDIELKDNGDLYARIEDENKNIYYEWTGEIGDLARQEGKNTFYLMAQLEKKLKKGQEYFAVTGINNSNSSISLRACESEAQDDSIGELITENSFRPNGNLYMNFVYIDVVYPLVYVLVLALVFLGILFLKVYYKDKEISFDLFLNIVLLSTPGIMYLLFESINGNLFTIPLVYMVINIIIIYLIYFVAVMLFHSCKCVITINIILYFFAIANYYVVFFRGSSIKIWDFLAIGTVDSVIDNYTFNFTVEMLVGFCILFIINLICSQKIKFRKVSLNAKIIKCGCACISSYVIFLLAIKVLSLNVADINFFSIETNYQNKGYFYTTMALMQNMQIKRPNNYSEDLIKEIEKNITIDTLNDDELTKPDNIIIIMNESFSDLQSIENFETNETVMPFIESLNDKVLKGKLYIPTFGGQTAKTEYEVLTGNSSHFLPTGSVAYQTICKEGEKGLASILKEQGYTTVAMHPFGGKNWSRDRVYSYMNFDEFLTIDDYKDYPTIRNYVSDLGNYQKIIDYYEAKDPEEKLFLS